MKSFTQNLLVGMIAALATVKAVPVDNSNKTEASNVVTSTTPAVVAATAPTGLDAEVKMAGSWFGFGSDSDAESDHEDGSEEDQQNWLDYWSSGRFHPQKRGLGRLQKRGLGPIFDRTKVTIGAAAATAAPTPATTPVAAAPATTSSAN